MIQTSAVNVFLGRSSLSIQSSGNQLYRAAIAQDFEEYQHGSTPDQRKLEIVQGIIDQIYHRGGRFLEILPDGLYTRALSATEVRKKVQADLRNKKPSSTPSETEDPATEGERLARTYADMLQRCHEYIQGVGSRRTHPKPSSWEAFVIEDGKPSEPLFVLADAFGPSYKCAKKDGKDRIVDSLICVIQDFNGKFLFDNPWKRVSQALRDSKKANRRRRGKVIEEFMIRNTKISNRSSDLSRLSAKRAIRESKRKQQDVGLQDIFMEDPLMNSVFLNTQEDQTGERSDEEFIGAMCAAAEIDHPVPSSQPINHPFEPLPCTPLSSSTGKLPVYDPTLFSSSGSSLLSLLSFNLGNIPTDIIDDVVDDDEWQFQLLGLDLES